jgi:energy-coupling factor transporter ATP-binding protein EcfA2
MSYATQAALRRCGLFPLHAAGLREPAGEKGLLIIGESGSGKSTLAVQLAAAGWRYLSDDSIALTADNTDGLVAAHGLRRRFAVTDRSLTACGMSPLSEAVEEHMPSDETKRYIDPVKAFPGQLASSCRPRVLLFPTIANQSESTVERISRSAAMIHLATFSPWACYDASTSREHLRVLAGLIQQTHAYMLQAGRDLIEQPGRAASLLNEICHENTRD